MPHSILIRPATEISLSTGACTVGYPSHDGGRDFSRHQLAGSPSTDASSEDRRRRHSRQAKRTRTTPSGLPSPPLRRGSGVGPPTTGSGLWHRYPALGAYS